MQRSELVPEHCGGNASLQFCIRIQPSKDVVPYSNVTNLSLFMFKICTAALVVVRGVRSQAPGKKLVVYACRAVSGCLMRLWLDVFVPASSCCVSHKTQAAGSTLQFHLLQHFMLLLYDYHPAGALACICGSSGRWIIRRTAVTIGRSSDTKGDVDVDLTKATTAAPANTASAGLGSSTPGVAATGGGFANIATAAETALGDARKVSRLQAQLSLELDGSWSLQNTGRAGVVVNGLKVK